MGHIAREFEAAGIPTVAFGVQAFKSRMVPMKVPRLVITPELMGRTMGMPRDAATQRRYLEIGLDLLEDASEGNSLVDIEN